MKKKFVIVIGVGCLLLLLNIGIMGFPLDKINLSEGDFEEPNVLSPYCEENDLSESHDEIVIGESEVRDPFVQRCHADAGGPYSGKINQAIQFDASNSYIDPLEISYYEWDFGDGKIGYGKNPIHKYSSPGVYYALLTIKNDNGDSYQDITPTYIDQEGDHLHPYGGCFYYAEKDESILFDGSKSISSNPEIEISKWIWHFGDGEIDYGKEVIHSYSEEKVYLVTLEIIDSNGCKRQDILHADIGVSYSHIEDFFINCNTKLTSIMDILLNRVGSFILYPLLFVKIYTNYNGYEETIALESDYMLPLTIDVNHDGDGDIKVNNLNFFNPVISQSQFNDFPWFAFETTISDIEIISDDITTEDDFEIGLQFSLQIMQDFLELEESIVRIGYHSASGEEKPNHFSATHIFRPYILLRILSGGTNTQPQSEESNTCPEEQVAMHNQIQLNTIKSFKATQPINKDCTTEITNRLPSDIITSDNEKDFEKPSKSYDTIGNGLKLITENGIRIENTNTDYFTLLISFSNVAETTKTKLQVTFESFTTTTLMHRRGKSNSDLYVQGSDDSSITLSITRENLNGNATIGILVNPLQSFGFHVDINRLANNARHVLFNIDNPPDNLILFTENEDSQGYQDSQYFYLRNLPNNIELEWLPRLDNGYIILTKELESDELEVGVCDDLMNPRTNIYMSNLPSSSSINWNISATTPHTITFSSDTDGLTLNAELRDINQGNQTITFNATSNEDLDIKLQWSLIDGYFELQRSTKNIDFDFLLLQDDVRLHITGNYIGGSEDSFMVHFNNFHQGIIELISDKSLNLDIYSENPWTQTILKTGLEFSTGGNIVAEWDESLNVHIDGAALLEVYNFTLSSLYGSVAAEEIALQGVTNFDLILKEGNQLHLSGKGQISLTQFKGEIGDWSSEINSVSTGGGLDILLKPKDKYYQVVSNHSITIQGFDFEYDGIGEIHDMNFEIDYFDMYSKGTTWFDFSTDIPKFNFDGEDVVDINDLHLSIGSGSSSVINFNISNAHLDTEGTIYGEWNNDYLFVDAEVDFNWNIAITTLNYGKWEATGSFEGSASMNAEWKSGSGNIDFEIGKSGFYHNLEIIHDDLILNLGSFDFEPGNVTFEWQREKTASNGYFNILNKNVNGTVTLFNISHKDLQNPFELKLADIEIESGDLYLEWSRRTNQKMVYIDNEMNVDMDLIKATWDEKTLTLGDLNLNPGEFKFIWNIIDKEINLNNGMSGLGPTISYEDNARKLSLSLLNLQDDFTKTMTLKWFEEQNGNISGVLIDTDNTNLVKWIEFTSIKYNSSGNIGRKLALNGLNADQFKIVKNLDNNLEITGRIYIGNNLTYSKLINDDWKDINIKWDLNLDGIGNIEFTIDQAFTLDCEISSKFSGVDINSTFDLPRYLKFGWDVDFDGNGFVSIDTNDEEIYDIDFKISKNTQSYQPKWGLNIGAAGLKAEDYKISWDFTPPPGQWVLIESGYIEPGSLNYMHLAWNGKWFNILAGGTPL